MTLLKTSFLSGIATVIKMLSNFILNKIIAIYIGPSGIAMIGQFQNVLQAITTMGTGGITTGVTKYAAEFGDNQQERDKYTKVSFFIILTFSLLVSVFVFIFRKGLAVNILGSSEYSNLFAILSVSVTFVGLNNYFLALLNGLKQIPVYIGINIAGSIVTLAITGILTVYYSLFGALLSLVVSQSIIFVIAAVYFFYKKIPVNPNTERLENRGEILRNFSRYALMALTTMTCAPVIQFLIRDRIIREVSIRAAGQWEGVNRISSMYFLIITTALATYYLPRLSEIKAAGELKKEVKKSYQIIIPFVTISCFGIFLLKDQIILLLFSKDFLQMRELFFYQLLGDFLKLCSWIIGYIMLARAMTKAFILTEIAAALVYFTTSSLLIRILSVKGVTLAYFITYLLYFSAMLLIYQRVLKEMKDPEGSKQVG